MLQDVVVHHTVTRVTYSLTQGPWKPPPGLIALCPVTSPGAPAGTGFIDPVSLSGPYRLTGLLWSAAVLLLVLVCYLTARASLNRGFVVKWYLYWLATIVLAALIPLAVLSLAHPMALAGSCEGIDAPFATKLLFDQILPTMVSAAGWAAVAFPLLSLAGTQLAGRHPASRGFFHYQGCPWPRWNPFAS
jgi:hypothetical protein